MFTNGENLITKIPPGDFQVTTPETPLLSQQAVTSKEITNTLPLPKLHYYHNKRLQVKESQEPYQPTVEPLSQYPIRLVL